MSVFAVLLATGLVCGALSAASSVEPADGRAPGIGETSGQAGGSLGDRVHGGPPVPLNVQKTVLLDLANKRLLLKTEVVLRDGLLEMFLCKAHTKEHESIVAIDAEAYVIHAGLLALGAKSGEPVRFDPEYRPPQGQTIDIFVNWTDENGRAHRLPAQKWMRHVTRRYYVEDLAQLPAGFTVPDESELRYDERRKELIWFGPMTEKQRDELLALSNDADYEKAIRSFFGRSQTKQMEAEFVFAGSGFHTDEDGQRFYLAESGNVICVANFSDALIDIAVKSTADNEGLMFEPYTERIPPLGTKVAVELVPRFEKPRSGEHAD